MEWLQRLNDAIAYIEAHLTEQIHYEEAAKIACCSTFHFQRMFAYIAGVPLSEYIRRRRMTAAAFELQQGNVKVIDLAFKYGYESPTAFNRAFRSVHGMAPQKAKEAGVRLKTYPPIAFQISIKGDTEMEYRIEQKDAFRIAGVKTALDKDIEKNFATVPLFWQQAAERGIVGRLAALIGQEPAGILGVSACMGEGEWEYYIAVATDAPIPADWQTYTVPASTWAIFKGTGTMPHSIQELEKRIVTEWLPVSGYEYGNAPDIEVYLNADPQNAVFEVWLPVSKKS